MQLPMRQVSIWSTKPLSSLRTSEESCDIGLALSGECGPTMWGSNFDNSISITLLKYPSGLLTISSSGVSRFWLSSARLANEFLPVAVRYVPYVGHRET